LLDEGVLVCLQVVWFRELTADVGCWFEVAAEGLFEGGLEFGEFFD